MIEIKPCRSSDILGDADMIAEYASESSITHMPPINAQADMYAMLETSGAMRCYGAYKDGVMVGFATVLTSVLPHYGALTSITESIFIIKKHRKSGAGMALIRHIENDSADRGSVGLLVSAPSGGSLSKVLPHVGYEHTNEVFFKGF